MQTRGMCSGTVSDSESDSDCESESDCDSESESDCDSDGDRSRHPLHFAYDFVDRLVTSGDAFMRQLRCSVG